MAVPESSVADPVSPVAVSDEELLPGTLQATSRHRQVKSAAAMASRVIFAVLIRFMFSSVWDCAPGSVESIVPYYTPFCRKNQVFFVKFTGRQHLLVFRFPFLAPRIVIFMGQSGRFTVCSGIGGDLVI